MAHFEDDHHHRVSGETLPIRVGHTRALYQWGGNFDGSPLYIVAADPSVLQIHEETRSGGFGANYRKFTIRALRDANTVQVFVGPNTDGSAPWDTVTFVVLTSAESTLYYRDRVMTLARTNLGAHYLWGAAGACPDMANGMPGRPGSVLMWTRAIDPDDIMTSTAICRVSGSNTCAGKPRQPGSQTPAYIPNAAGIPAGTETPQLSYRTVHTAYRTNRKPGIILGERCESKRHFDCVGFVNYCLSIAFGESVQMDICGDATHGYRGYANAMVQVPTSEAHHPGDILIFGGTEVDFEGRRVLTGSHHIAFSVGDGVQMLHASETEYGVVQTGIGADLKRRVRHPRLV